MIRSHGAWLATMLALLLSSAAVAEPLLPYEVVADGIPTPLTSEPGSPARGREIVLSRTTGLCLLCHSGPFPEQPSQGTLAPDLAGAGARWSEAQLRLRIVDGRRLDPSTPMPSYYRGDDRLVRVAPAWRGRPILSAQQVEDVIAFLRTLREPAAVPK